MLVVLPFVSLFVLLAVNPSKEPEPIEEIAQSELPGDEADTTEGLDDPSNPIVKAPWED